MADKKPFLLRLDPALYEELRRWADDELRSMNAQVEFLLRRAVQTKRRSGRGVGPPERGEQRADGGGDGGDEQVG